MDTIRKSPAPQHKQRDGTPETNADVQQGHPARPLDLLFQLDSCAGEVIERASENDARVLHTARSPLFRRITPKPRRLAAPASVGTPDWSLSIGAAVVLLGLAIGVGTYITLTQRDAMQNRLRRVASQNELRAMPRREHATIAERAQELARTLRNQIEALHSRDPTDAAVVAGAASNPSASAHSSSLASSVPTLPSVPTPRFASSDGTPGKPSSAKQPPPPLPQPAPRTRQLASAPPARANNSTTTALQVHRVSAKPASQVCGPRSPCIQANAQTTHKLMRSSTTTAQRKPHATAVASRKAAAGTSVEPVQRPLPVTMQAYSPRDIPAPPPVVDDVQIYRQH
ncbi:hypothetical protein J8I87_08680 [Paraburkholderia sp. LEh10]|uniref:hypothetical protein n=1 Tax=Paraburkholderia sp. LEh10 TaxID=2821353 RepID=UPI001AE9510D|nr:hypothetical protein [Paraburkholderia sp. LEh10]MBP0589790.1 hypothetical protein [Paraburkholderia sp. LEh10]